MSLLEFFPFMLVLCAMVTGQCVMEYDLMLLCCVVVMDTSTQQMCHYFCCYQGHPSHEGYSPKCKVRCEL